MLVVTRSAEDAAVAIEGGADGLVIRLGADENAGNRMVCEAAARVAGRRCPIVLLCPDGAPTDLLDLIDRYRPDEVYVPLETQAAPLAAAGIKIGATLPFAGRLEEAAFEEAACQARSGLLFGEGAQPRRLLQVVTVVHLQEQVRWARTRGLTIGFAGTMEMPDIPRLLAIAPDFLVFDETVRPQGPPSDPIDPERVRFVREVIPTRDEEALGAAQTAPEAASRDHIFVRDWTVSIHLGAYRHERIAQRVRFTIDVEVMRVAARPADLRDIVTYDLITDAISRATVDHVELVETIAEDVASAILAHPRVTSVDVTVEKLDLGPGSLGCRIIRGRDRLG